MLEGVSQCYNAKLDAAYQKMFAAGQSAGILLTCSIDKAVVGIEVVQKILSQGVLFQLIRLVEMHQ